MTGARLEVPGYEWTSKAFESAIASRVAELEARLANDGRILPFDATVCADTVWTLHALRRLGAVALPVPPLPSPHLQDVYQAAAQQPASSNTRLRLLTSGSTGTPSVVDLTDTQLNASVQASKARLGCTTSDRWLCCLPLHHIAGISVIFRTVDAGATAVLQPQFEPSRVNHAIDHGGITMISGRFS